MTTSSHSVQKLSDTRDQEQLLLQHCLIPQILFDFWPEPILHIRGCMALAIYRWGYIFLIILIIDSIPLSVMKACVAGNSLLGANWHRLYISSYLPEWLQSNDHKTTHKKTSKSDIHLDMAYSWLGVVIFDLCIFGLTLWKTLRMRRYYALCGGIGTILMRDVQSLKDFTRDLLATFCTVTASITVSHLMLNLKGKKQKLDSKVELQFEGLLTLVCATLVGSNSITNYGQSTN
ncbi:hypothetical protein DFH05DRAFT_1461845 [Lentinula detonsa]|uniref:Uncharacterized protein n=1 Tax=Lentinula detonsa TaxID=2804962 RepID=A0A9W8NVI8_9AGAR|nr:hypothetical protein DFH05DRAFT_1461845 [Lentinula detonsa]